jgi:tRNA 2-thiouridine synthesizing protein E
MDAEKTKPVTFEDKTYVLDENGFLHSPEQWDEVFAAGMARSLGMSSGLNDEHWRFIRFLRIAYETEERVPVVVLACAANKLRLGKFRELFPQGYFRGACRIAGLNPQHMKGYWCAHENVATLRSEYRLTPLGFLADFERWSLRFAELVADEWKLPDGLTRRHTDIIYLLRRSFSECHRVPTIVEACRAGAIGLEEFGELFPCGYRRGACRAAGLPFPDRW